MRMLSIMPQGAIATGGVLRDVLLSQPRRCSQATPGGHSRAATRAPLTAVQARSAQSMAAGGSCGCIARFGKDASRPGPKPPGALLAVGGAAWHAGGTGVAAALAGLQRGLPYLLIMACYPSKEGRPSNQCACRRECVWQGVSCKGLRSA